MSSRGRAGRDDDEPAPLAHVALRLDRHLAPLLPLVALGGRCGAAGRPSHGARFSALRLLPGKHRPLQRPKRFPAQLARSTSSTGLWPCSCSLCCSATRRECGGTRSGRDRSIKVPLQSYVAKAYLLPAHFITQMRYAQCERKRPWLTHLVLMLSYVTMLVLIMFFLSKMASGPKIDWARAHLRLSGHRRAGRGERPLLAQSTAGSRRRSTSTHTNPTGCSSCCFWSWL